MRRLILGCALAAALLAPVTASAKPTKADKTNAAKQCRAEREAIGVEAFRAEYGSNKNGKNAFGKCVSQKVKEDSEEEPS